MMICQLDKNGYCERHRRIHQKGEIHLALDPGPKGEHYRQLWDDWLAGKRTSNPYPENRSQQSAITTSPQEKEVAQEEVVKASTHPLPLRSKKPCKHLGEPTGETRKCQVCGGGDKSVALYQCAVYGVCTVDRQVRKIGPDGRVLPEHEARCSRWCKGYNPEESQ